MEEFAFSRGLDHAAIVAASERVAWTVDAVVASRQFDASRCIVPASWVGTQELGFLDEHEQRVLNQCRAFSYVHLLGNFEEFAPPHLAAILERDWHADRARLRSLLRFGDEELKHQQLFQRAERLLEESCGHRFDRCFDEDKVRVTELTRAILAHQPLARSLLVLAFEWGTQRHYVASIRDRDDCDPLYCDVLKAHWVEEAQHIKSGTLEIAHLARQLSAKAIRASFDAVSALGALIDRVFADQAAAEVDTLIRVTGRTLAASELLALRTTLHQSLSAILTGVGLSHPNFVEVALALSRDGAAVLGIA
jgi:hypothetical protein